MDQEKEKYRVVLQAEGCLEYVDEESRQQKDVTVVYMVEITSNLVQIGQNAEVFYNENETEQESIRSEKLFISNCDEKREENRKLNYRYRSATSSESENG